jgi:hypothetical protein
MTYNTGMFLNDIPRVEGVYGPIETELRDRAGIEGPGANDQNSRREYSLLLVLEGITQKYIPLLQNSESTRETRTHVFSEAAREMTTECEKHDAEVGTKIGTNICTGVLGQLMIVASLT